jgi:hypothetical protein
MKKVIILCLAIITGSLQIFAGDNYKLYENKSGIIEYEMTGASVGTQKIVFDNYGESFVVETKSTFFGNPNNSRTYVESDTSFTVDLVRNNSYKFHNQEFSKLRPYQHSAKSVSEAIRKFLEKKGGELIGSEKINGYDCEIWELKQKREKIWLYKSYKLRIESGLDKDKMVYKLKNIQFDVEIAPEFFTKPDKPYPNLMKAK